MHAELPGGEVSPKHLVHEAVNVIERHGQIGQHFFEILAEERPARRDEIWAVAGRMPGPTAVRAPGPHASAQPAMLWRSRRLALVGVGVALVALMTFAIWPRLSIGAFPGTSGGIVLAVRGGVGDEPGRIHRGLCTALQERDAQAVRCVELPRFGIDHDDLLEASSGAGASLLAELDADHDLHLASVSTTAELHSGMELLAAVRTLAADLVVLDLGTHGLGGLLLVSAVEELARGLPILAVSVGADVDARPVVQKGIPHVVLGAERDGECRHCSPS